MGCDLIFGGRKTQGKIMEEQDKKTPQEIVYDPKKWEIDGETVNHYNGKQGDVIIPDGVKKIANEAFYNNGRLKSVTIPESVTNIGDRALDDCKNLASVFYNGTLAQWCAVDKGNCSFMERASVILIGENNMDTKTLTALKIPDGITKIVAGTFVHLKKLETVEIPASVTSISESAFFGCYNIANVFYNGTLAQWCAVDKSSDIMSTRHVILIGENNMDTKTLTTFKIPESVTKIGKYTFNLHEKLETMEIPASVTSIGEYAFRNCTNLKSVTIPESVTSIGKGAFDNCTNFESITIPAGVTSIGYGMFYACKNLKSVTIPESVTSIDDYVFQSCTSLKTVEIPTSVTKLGSGVFSNCTSLESVTIPESVTSIARSMFDSCKSLKSVTIPASVTSICCSFKDSKNLASVFYNGTLAQWCAVDKELSGFMEPESMILIGENNMDTKTLTTLKIPDGVTKIGKSTFALHKNLETVEIPASVTSIGDSAFSKCTSLKSVNYGGTKEQWDKIEITRWSKEDFKNCVIHCTDGDITAE